MTLTEAIAKAPYIECANKKELSALKRKLSKCGCKIGNTSDGLIVSINVGVLEYDIINNYDMQVMSYPIFPATKFIQANKG